MRNQLHLTRSSRSSELARSFLSDSLPSQQFTKLSLLVAPSTATSPSLSTLLLSSSNHRTLDSNTTSSHHQPTSRSRALTATQALVSSTAATTTSTSTSSHNKNNFSLPPTPINSIKMAGEKLKGPFSYKVAKKVLSGPDLERLACAFLATENVYQVLFSSLLSYSPTLPSYPRTPT